MDQGILEWSNEPFTENHMKLIQKLGSGWVEIHEGKILLTFSFEGPKHVMFGRARGAATHQQVNIESTRIEKQQVRTQCHCHRTTHTHTPTFNAARTTTKHHIPIQNDHRATRTHTDQASKCSRRHNETPRYDSKWQPRHTRTHARLQNAARTTTGHHVTIENGHRATQKPSIITWCSRFKEIYNFFFREHHGYD